MKPIKTSNQTFQLKNFLLFAAFFGILRQILLSGLPINALTTGGMDDALMVRGAWSMISQGFRGWLGPYDSLTLVKGFFFPAFLAAAHKIGISYLAAAVLLYTLSCCLFTIAISRLFQTKYPLYFSYLLLLFNPGACSGEVLQRVYRNSLTPSQVLLIFGGFFAMYLRRKEGAARLLPWALLTGLSWASLEHSREDAIWLLPAALLITLVSIITVIAENGGAGKWRTIPFVRCFLFLLPALLFSLSHPAVSYVNQMKYGFYTYNELNDSHFADAMKSIYRVKIEGEELEYVTASRKKLTALYEVSPSLAALKDTLEPMLDRWATVDRNPQDLEVEDGWFFWVLRAAAADCGYYESAGKADQFFQQMALEVQAACEDGRLQTQPVMPSALMPPWKKGRLPHTLQAMGEAIVYVSSFQGTATELHDSIPGGIPLFEAVTGNRALYPEEERIVRPDWQDYQESCTKTQVQRINRMGRLYQILGIPAALLGLLCWCLLTLAVLRTSGRAAHLSAWLILSALFGSLLCLIAGVSYNHAASCPSINGLYLCAAYPLLLAFWTLGFGYLLEHGIRSLQIKKYFLLDNQKSS